MGSGDIVSALRASMAIPAVFTTVERDGRRLVDGGVVNNFPVDVIKDMGAEYLIGMNVAQGLRPAGELFTPVDIIYQMVAFQDAQNFRANKELADIFIEPALKEFSIASFDDALEIIERGKQIARTYYPEFKKLAREQQSAGKKPEYVADIKGLQDDKLIAKQQNAETEEEATMPPVKMILSVKISW